MTLHMLDTRRGRPREAYGGWWPEGRYSFGDDGYAAVEESYEFQATLTSVAPEALQQVAVDAFNGLAAVYGVEPHSYDQIVALSK